MEEQSDEKRAINVKLSPPLFDLFKRWTDRTGLTQEELIQLLLQIARPTLEEHYPERKPIPLVPLVDPSKLDPKLLELAKGIAARSEKRAGKK